MYELLRHSCMKKVLPQQIFSGGGAFLLANHFYIFHSFALECIAFLLTWGILDYLSQEILYLLDVKN